jgi:hypothetical protein
VGITRCRKNVVIGFFGAFMMIAGTAGPAAATPANDEAYSVPVQGPGESITLGSMTSVSNYLHADGKLVRFNRDSHPGQDVVRKFAGKSGTVSPSVTGTNGYSGTQAASYEDMFVSPYNNSFISFGADCTNFTSQGLWAGGLKMTSEVSDDHHWWYDSGRSAYSASWVNVDSQANYLQYDVPGGTWRYTWGPSQDANTYTPSDIVTGDIVVYSWNGTNGGGRHHGSMQVGIGTDPNSGWYGNVIDQHTTDRYHAFWSLLPYNADASTTTYQLWHIWP